jgi:hypothetical protein
MTEFSLASYLVAGTVAISGAFGSHDMTIKDHVLAKTAPIIAEFGGEEGRNRIADGLDRILANPRIEKYHWHVALATEMLFAAYGTRPAKAANVSFPGFTENFIEPVKALGLPTIAEALDILAYSQEVRIPVPIDRWDDVSGQFYFDRPKIIAALGELKALGPISAAVDGLKRKKPEMFSACEPDDLQTLLESFSAVLGAARSANAELAIFRHGGV